MVVHFLYREQTFSITFLCVLEPKVRTGVATYGFGLSHDSWIYRISMLRQISENIQEHTYHSIGGLAFYSVKTF